MKCPHAPHRQASASIAVSRHWASRAAFRGGVQLHDLRRELASNLGDLCAYPSRQLLGDFHDDIIRGFDLGNLLGHLRARPALSLCFRLPTKAFHRQPVSPARYGKAERGFRFPLNDENAEPGVPKRRPCLVLNTLSNGDDRFVEIAYGTSADTRANRGYEVIVKHPTSREAAGLSKPTRFVGARRIIVHVNHRGFDGQTDGPEIIGKLDAPLLERLNAVRARIQAEADIAAHHREEQRAEQVRWEHEARGFR